MKLKYFIQAIETTKNDDYTGMVSMLPNRVKGALNRFNKKTRELEHETCLVMDSNGNKVIEKKDGDEYSIEIGKEHIPKEYLDSDTDLHLTHNHPTETILPTCLSKADCVKLLENNGIHADLETGRLELDLVFQSITAECSNGSRMTLAIKDYDKFMDSLEIDSNGKLIYDNIANDFCGEDHTSHIEKFYTEAQYAVVEHVDKWTHAQKDKGVDIHTDDFDKAWRVERDKFIKRYSEEHMAEFLKDDIKRFEDAGLELTIGWLK